MANQIPKKTTNIYTRVPENFKIEFKQALGKVGFSEAFFVRAAAEALVKSVGAGEDLALPISLLTIQKRDTLKKK